MPAARICAVDCTVTGTRRRPVVTERLRDAIVEARPDVDGGDDAADWRAPRLPWLPQPVSSVSVAAPTANAGMTRFTTLRLPDLADRLGLKYHKPRAARRLNVPFTSVEPALESANTGADTDRRSGYGGSDLSAAQGAIAPGNADNLSSAASGLSAGSFRQTTGNPGRQRLAQ